MVSLRQRVCSEVEQLRVLLGRQDGLHLEHVAQRCVLQLTLSVSDLRRGSLYARGISLLSEYRLRKLRIGDAYQFAEVSPLLIIALFDRYELLLLVGSERELRVDPVMRVCMAAVPAPSPTRRQDTCDARDNGDGKQQR